jgi:hypothetical protein
LEVGSLEGGLVGGRQGRQKKKEESEGIPSDFVSVFGTKVVSNLVGDDKKIVWCS